MGRANTAADVFRFINTHDNDTTVCWQWTGSLGGRDGRGYITIDGKKYLAHRVVYQLFNGEIPEGQVVRHTCDNPQCCNPLHLETGSRGDNELDKYRRGRAGLPLHVVNEVNRLNRAAKREGLDISYAAIKKSVDARFSINISIASVGRIIRGERRREQSDAYNKESKDDSEGREE